MPTVPQQAPPPTAPSPEPAADALATQAIIPAIPRRVPPPTGPDTPTSRPGAPAARPTRPAADALTTQAITLAADLPTAALPPPTIVIPPLAPPRLGAMPAGALPVRALEAEPVTAVPAAGSPAQGTALQRRLLVGVVAGLLAVFLVFGVAGYWASVRGPLAGAGPAAEESTLDIFGGDSGLATLGTAWVPAATGCAGATGAPGERTHVTCALGALSLHFVRFESVAERDKARVTRRARHDDAARLAPGATHLLGRPGVSHRTKGEYVEYAYVAGTGADAPIVGGLWWDDRDEPVAAYLEAPWVKGLGGDWAPLREAWQRYS